MALYEDHEIAWEMLEASGIIAQGAKTSSARKHVKKEQATPDVLAQYARANKRNEQAIDKSEAKLEKWDLSVKEALAILRVSIKDNADVKRVVAALDKSSPDLLWNAMAALKALEKDDDDDKTDTVVQLFTAVFKSGDTSTIHVDKFKELVAKTKQAHGDKISIDALAKLLFKKNLLLFPEFATVSQAIAQQSSDATLADTLTLFQSSLKQFGEIHYSSAEFQLAAQTLFDQMFAPTKEAQPKARATYKERRAKKQQREGTGGLALGGAAKHEGASAFLANGLTFGGMSEGKGAWSQKGKGAWSPNTNDKGKGKGSRQFKGGGKGGDPKCGLCLKTGHFAATCRGTPSKESTDPRAVRYWQEQDAHSANVADVDGGWFQDDYQNWYSLADLQMKAKFADDNSQAFDAYKVRPQPSATAHALTLDVYSGPQTNSDHGWCAGDHRTSSDWHISAQAQRTPQVTSVGQTTTGSAGNNFAFVAPEFDRTDAENQKRLRRPLHQGRSRASGKRSAAMVVDSGASQHLAPADEVESLGKNVTQVQDRHVATAAAGQKPMDVTCDADIYGKAKVEKGHYKSVPFRFSGVSGMDKWLMSVAQIYRENGEVRFAQPEKGGCKLRLHNSEEWIPIEFVDDKYFRIVLHIDDTVQLSSRQKQEHNFHLHCLAGHLDKKMLQGTDGLVRNFVYYKGADFGTDETCLTQKGQMGPMPPEHQFRPAKVGAVTFMDLAKIDKDFGVDSHARWMLTTRDAAGNFRRRYYLRSTAQLHNWVRKHRDFVRSKGWDFAHVRADNEFITDAMDELKGETPTFTLDACAPHVHAQNPAEADIKAWRLRVRTIMDNARRDPKSKVTDQHWCIASEMATDIENMTFCPQSPERTPWESMYREQPDASIWQIPLCRIWYFVYPNLRRNAPFASRRAEGIFYGYDPENGSYKIVNLATGRRISRRYRDCVTREPHEVWDYNDVVTAAEKLYKSGNSEFESADRMNMFERHAREDNMSDIPRGNDPKQYFIGPVRDEQDRSLHKHMHNLVTNQVKNVDSESQDSDSNSDSESEDDADWQEYTTETDNETPKTIAEKYGCTAAQMVARNPSPVGEVKLYQKSKLKKGTGMMVPRHVIRADFAQAQAERNGKLNRPPSSNRLSSLSYAMLSQVHSKHVEAANFADSVLGTENMPAFPSKNANSSSKLSPYPLKLPEQVHPSGEKVQQVLTVDMHATAEAHVTKQALLRNNVLEAFLADLHDQVKQPRSFKAGLLDPHQKQHWLDGDSEETQRIKDFKAAEQVPYSEAEQSGEYIGHIIRVIKIKELTEKGVVIDREYKVRYAFDESRKPDSDDDEHFAAVLRTQTSRLLNLKATHERKKVLRADLVSAFLHVPAEKPFFTRYPSGHPDEYKNGVRQAMKWYKLLYGKGNASRGLWHDFAATLISLGFEQQVNVDQCLFIHKTRNIDFGLYVDDCEAAATDEQLDWLKKMIAKRYEVKWLGFNSLNCKDSSEKSKVFVGIRTEIDHANQIMTQDQTQLIQKAAVRFKWDGRKRFSPPVASEFPPLQEGAKVNTEFHKRYRSKVGFVAHVAVQTRFDINEHAVKAARRLNDPVPECEKYIDEVLQFLFTTAEDRLTYNCSQPIGSTLLMHTDAAFADTFDAHSTGGWVSSAGGAAWSWGVDTLRLVVLSSTEAEYCTTANACKEVLAQRALFKAFRIDFPMQYPILVDNQSAIALACGPAAHHQRTKHIDTKYHFQRQLLLAGVVRLQHQDTTVQVADILTKDLGRILHRKHRDVLFGRKQIEIISKKLPESTKTYLKRHNDELKLNAKTLALTQAFKSNASSKLWAGRDPDKETDGSSVAANLLQVLSAILKD